MSSKILVANWKMNGSMAECIEYFDDLLSGAIPSPSAAQEAIVFCPSFPYLLPLQHRLIEDGFTLGAQGCSEFQEGAYTGEVAATMLKDVGCTHVLIGHSERRQHQNESNQICKAKLERAHDAGLTAIYCIGETKEDRESGNLEKVLSRQLLEGLSSSSTSKNTLIAYEPAWSIGTGLTPSLTNIQETHALIQSLLSKSPAMQEAKILYGGSVKATNAKNILSLTQVSGALIGGASLDPKNMAEIVKAANTLSDKAASFFNLRS